MVRRENRLLRVDSAQRMGDCAGEAEAEAAAEEAEPCLYEDAASPSAAAAGCSWDRERLGVAELDGVREGAGRGTGSVGRAMGAAFSGGGKYGMVGCCR